MTEGKSKGERRDGINREGVGFSVVSGGGNGVGGMINFDYFIGCCGGDLPFIGD